MSDQTEAIPEVDATPDEAFELGKIAGYDEAMREAEAVLRGVASNLLQNHGAVWADGTQMNLDARLGAGYWIGKAADTVVGSTPEGQKDA